MPTTTSTILDQISAEKTKISERLARLDADREKIDSQLTDLETAERGLIRRDANPARKARAWASVFSPWPLAKPDKNFTRHVPAIAQTTSASRCSATSAR